MSYIVATGFFLEMYFWRGRGIAFMGRENVKNIQKKKKMKFVIVWGGGISPPKGPEKSTE